MNTKYIHGFLNFEVFESNTTSDCLISQSKVALILNLQNFREEDKVYSWEWFANLDPDSKRQQCNP